MKAIILSVHVVRNAGKQAMQESKQCGKASDAGKQAMQESKQCRKASNAGKQAMQESKQCLAERPGSSETGHQISPLV